MHNSNLKRAKKNFLDTSKGKIDMFISIQREFCQAKKLNGQNFGLCGPNKKLSRATFGPRAVCCACLIQIMTKQYQFSLKNGNTLLTNFRLISSCFRLNLFYRIVSSFQVKRITKEEKYLSCKYGEKIRHKSNFFAVKSRKPQHKNF